MTFAGARSFGASIFSPACFFFSSSLSSSSYWSSNFSGSKCPDFVSNAVGKPTLANMRELGVHQLIGFRLNDACRHQVLGRRAYRFVNRLVYSTTAIISISTIASG